MSAVDERYRHPRSRRLVGRATFCLLTAALPGLFLLSALVGSGGLWTPFFWGGLVVVAAPALVAAYLLARVSRMERQAGRDVV